MDELTQIRERYERRKNIPAERYSIFNPATYLIEQEKERAVIKLFKENKLLPLENKKILEIGCGAGTNLLNFLKLGFNPANIYANDLIEERLEYAKKILPSEVKIFAGNALDLNFSDNSFDIVFQSMVFSSILDNDFKKKLADKMWNWVKPGGGILWYDFTFNNPANPDVKGIKPKEVKEIFNQKSFYIKRLTLAPPVARAVTKIHPNFYHILNSLYFFRTHVLIWIRK